MDTFLYKYYTCSRIGPLHIRPRAYARTGADLQRFTTYQPSRDSYIRCLQHHVQNTQGGDRFRRDVTKKNM